MPYTGFEINETIILRKKRSLAHTQYFSVQIAGVFTYQALADTLNRLTDLFHGNRNLRIIQGVWPSKLVLNEYYRIEPCPTKMTVEAHSNAVHVDVSKYQDTIHSSHYLCNELMTIKQKKAPKLNKNKVKAQLMTTKQKESLLKLNRDAIKEQFLDLYACSKRTKIFKKFKINYY